MRMCFATGFVISQLLAAAAPVARGDEQFEQAATLLARHGIRSNADEIRNYLNSLTPDGKARRRQADLIRGLGHKEFFTRENSMANLLRLPVLSVDLLEKATRGRDPEIRWRAKYVLKHADERSAGVLRAAFTVIRTKGLPGLADELIGAIPSLRKQYLLDEAQGALQATVRESDLARLRKSLRHADPRVRIAAIGVLDHLLGKKSIADLGPMAKDADDNVRMTAARLLANRGQRSILPVLAALLDSEELRVRVEAVRTLRSLTGQRFKFVAYESAKIRAASRKKWSAWVKGPGQSAALRFPLKVVRVELGRTLVCLYSSNEVYELDAQQNIVWKVSTDRYPWACQGLPNGHRLIACYAARLIVEYDNHGKEVWRHTGLPGAPTSVQRLPNGNTLVACSDSQQVLEISPDKKVAWKATITGRPTDARRLSNGRTLIAVQNGRRVVEVDAAGKVVWEITGIHNPFSAERLENGNTLVACSSTGTVAEYDRSGKAVWSKTGFASCYSAQRLSNGNTLISQSTGLTEINSDGKRLWTKGFSNVAKSHRY